MARYIDEKDVYKLVEPTGIARVHCSQIDELPRADVVPKSEVADLQDALKCEKETNKHLSDEYIALMKENEKLTINMNAYGLTAKRLAEEKDKVERLEGELIVERTRRKNAVDAYHAAKSEVETEYKYCHVVGCAKVYTKTLEDYYKTRKSIAKEGKAEVAREIFEEIKKLIHSLETPINKYWVLLPNELAELKKKYTGENIENENQN